MNLRATARHSTGKPLEHRGSHSIRSRCEYHAVLRHAAFCLTCVAVFSMPLLAQEKPRFPGPTEKGFLLPNGWHITPIGQQVDTSDLPLNILPLADGKHVLVACDGFNRHELLVIDLAEHKAVDRQSVFQSWFGLAASKDQDRVWWAGG